MTKEGKFRFGFATACVPKERTETSLLDDPAIAIIRFRAALFVLRNKFLLASARIAGKRL